MSPMFKQVVAEMRECMEKAPEFRQATRRMMDAIKRGDYVLRGRWVKRKDDAPSGQEWPWVARSCLPCRTRRSVHYLAAALPRW
jgi:hypothetical protein